MLAVTSTCFSQPAPDLLQQTETEIISRFNLVIEAITSMVSKEGASSKTSPNPLDEIKEMLHKEASTLNKAVIENVVTTLNCANEYNLEHNNILTIIDYSLPSSEKRLWVFDLNEKKLLFHTYVSHGIKSGALFSNSFSNKHDSKASSIGVYTTEQTYYGRDGLSLRLDGLDNGFNDNASSRSVVMHSGWYVDENFIKKYGRAGRSWGCPALPPALSQSIINTIKNKSLFVIYYPSDNWFIKSKFQKCNISSPLQHVSIPETDVKPLVAENELREDILFADLNQNKKHEENEPVIVVSADSYEHIFHTKAPLTRMLRRQINNAEYIALSNTEFTTLVTNRDKIPSDDKEGLNAVHFVIPVIKMTRGYYETQMQIVTLGKIKEASINTNSSTKDPINSYTVHCDAKPFLTLRPTNRFIRWVGL